MNKLTDFFFLALLGTTIFFVQGFFNPPVPVQTTPAISISDERSHSDGTPKPVESQALPTASPSPTLQVANPEQIPSQPTPESQPVYSFGNPAGCGEAAPLESDPGAMLDALQADLGSGFNLSERRRELIWNGELGQMLDVSQDRYAFEFDFNEAQPPLIYLGDQVASTFQAHGFVTWFRAYGGSFRLLAVAMRPGVLDSAWAGYVRAYWEKNGTPLDEKIIPALTKLPCHWVIEQGFVSDETLPGMFNFNWNMPDYLAEGQQYLAETCHEAYKISREKVGYPDASSMCGPLSWIIMRNANGFPYRMGSWYSSAAPFTAANPKLNGQPWGSFDPQTFDLIHTEKSMPGYNFERLGNLYPGDIVYSYSVLYKTNDDPHFDHLFLVAGIGAANERLAISNMIRNYPYKDCSIELVRLYSPGDCETGAINHEWNGFGFGQTGTSGFDIFRWKWISYHINGKAAPYTVRWGETLETIAFDWKIPPHSLADRNQLENYSQLQPGQLLSLPDVEPFSERYPESVGVLK